MRGKGVWRMDMVVGYVTFQLVVHRPTGLGLFRLDLWLDRLLLLLRLRIVRLFFRSSSLRCGKGGVFLLDFSHYCEEVSFLFVLSRQISQLDIPSVSLVPYNPAGESL
jgi:hypothetical protein